MFAQTLELNRIVSSEFSTVQTLSDQSMNPSIDILVSNQFEAFWRPFIRGIQLCCASHYNIFRSTNRKNSLESFLRLVYFLLFTTINMSLVAVATARGLQCEATRNSTYKPHHKESTLMYYINSLTVLGNLVTHSAICLEALLCGNREKELMQKLKTIDVIFASKLNHQLDYTAKRTRYTRKIVSAFTLSCILCTASSFTTLPEQYHDKYFMQPILILEFVTNRIRWCYIVLILSSLADSLNDLQSLLRQHQLKSRKQSEKQPENGEIYDHIHHIREIYSNIWCAVTLLSDCFGWTFITYLLSMSLQSINSSYWLYINMSVYKSMDVNIRKMKRNMHGLDMIFSTKLNTIFFLHLDILLYMISVGIAFWLLCTMAEKCQRMVKIRFYFL